MAPHQAFAPKDPGFREQRQEKLENWTILISLALMLVFTVLDIASDIDEGASKFHLIDEAVITILAFAGFIFIWRRTLSLHRDVSMQQKIATQALKSRDEALAEATRWREEAAQSFQGLGDAIDAQFIRWGLTGAEKEVALLLLKGLSLREIADVRGVTEKTARAQSFSIYSKAGLGGRAELSAFFLEDLLTPSPKPVK